MMLRHATALALTMTRGRLKNLGMAELSMLPLACSM
jgi:hypothetical protein